MTDPGLTAAGIIAAGHGSRLRPARGARPKPMVEVGGKPLVHWVVEGLKRAGIRRVTLLLNSSGGPVRGYLEAGFPELDWTFLVADTASSWESFRLVSRRVAGQAERFIMSTVDALIPPADVARFAREAFVSGAQAALSLTRRVDDEKPLWAQTDRDGWVTALGTDARVGETVTCGLYALTGRLTRDFPGAAAYPRLRDYWAELVRSGIPVRGVLLGDTVDVDRPEDLAPAGRIAACFDA